MTDDAVFRALADASRRQLLDCLHSKNGQTLRELCQGLDPPKRLIIKWRNECRPEMKSEGYSRCTIDLEPIAGAVKLTITHVMDRAESKFIEAVSGGWPRILSNLKSLLETGEIVLQTQEPVKKRDNQGRAKLAW